MKNRYRFIILLVLSTFSDFQIGRAQGYLDAGVTSIISPTCSSIPAPFLDVTVVITNFGTVPITSILVVIDVNGPGTPLSFTYNGLLNPSASDTFYVTTLPFINFFQSICAYTIGDTIPANDTTCIFCGNPMSAGSAFDNSGLVIGPNPSSGKFSIKLAESLAINTTIEISDHAGRLIWKSEFIKPEFNIDFSDKANGLYFIRLKTPSEVFATKLLINK